MAGPTKIDAFGTLSDLLHPRIQNPLDETDTIVVHFDRQECLRRVAKGATIRVHNVVTANEALAQPERIRRGLRRNPQSGKMEDGYCYISEIGYERDGSGRKVDLDEEDIYVVFVSEENHVIDWGVELRDPKDNDHVEGETSRFGELLWSRT